MWLLEEIIGRPAPGHDSKTGPLPHGDALYDANLPLVETFQEARHFRLGADAFQHEVRPWREPIPSAGGARRPERRAAAPLTTAIACAASTRADRQGNGGKSGTARSAIIDRGAQFVLPEMTAGMIDASATRRPSIP